MNHHAIILSYSDDVSLQFDEDPNFDLYIFNYGKSKYPYECVDEVMVETECKGDLMFYEVSYIINNNLSYDYVGFFDDDIKIKVSELNRMFLISSNNNLDLSAPSLTNDSYSSHKFTLNCGSGVRSVPWVEVMMPCMSRRFLETFNGFIKSLYQDWNLVSGWGIDLHVFPLILRLIKGRCAIIDDIKVHHYRPISSNNRTFKNGYSAHKELSIVNTIINR